MKRYFVYRLLTVFAIYSSTFSFQIENPKSTLYHNDISILKSELSKTKTSLDSINRSFESINARIENQQEINNELKQTIQSSNQILSEQNSLINSFDAIGTWFAIGVAFFGIIIPLLFTIYNANQIKQDSENQIKLFERQSQLELERARLSYDDLKDKVNRLADDVKAGRIEIDKALTNFYKTLDEKITINFESFLAKDNKQGIDQALHNLKSNDEGLHSNAINYLQKKYPEQYSYEQLHKIKVLLQNYDLKESEINFLSSVLRYYGDNEFSDDFFLSLYHYPKLLLIKSIRTYAYSYLLNSRLEQRLNAVTDIILQSQNLTENYIEALMSIYSDNMEKTIDLINFKRLNDAVEINKEKVWEILRGSSYDTLRNEINQSYLANLVT